MTQLSPASQKALAHISNTLIAIERVIQLIKDFFLRKCPLFVKNIQTVLVSLKDLASFVPSIVYKSLLYVAVFSILLRKFNKWRNNRLAITEKPTTKPQVLSGPQQNLENLGPQYIVKQKVVNKSIVGNARTEIDSFYLEFQQFDDSKPKDFRDVVFFQLMRSYRSAEERERE